MSTEVHSPRVKEPTAKDLVTFFVDLARHRNGGDSPPRDVIGQVAKELGKLVKESHRPDVLYRGVEILVEKGLNPANLASCIFSAQSQLQGGSMEDLALLRLFLADNEKEGRWPTGWRQTHAQGLGFKEDPLGFDKPPAGYPNNRPDRKTVIAALRERSTE